MINNEILYIGLHGFAGSGKDTVAKALRLMLSYNWSSYEEFRLTWEREAFKMHYATFGIAPEDESCYCIAFADQLKYICSAMFGIPVDRFYYNKENAWICINDDFQYTEQQPLQSNIITAEEYYMENNSFSDNSSNDKKWMSLREVLVYVGTYVCQRVINKNCFINGVSNTIKQIKSRNRNLKYVICTDVRFFHELEFIKKHKGINIDIQRAGVEQLDNIAEHYFDDEDVFDFTLHNDGTYDELLTDLWSLVHDNIIFKNIVLMLPSRNGTKNYLRKIDENKYTCCFEYSVSKIKRDGGKITMIDPAGGPAIYVGSKIDIIPQEDTAESDKCINTVKSIYLDDNFGFVIETTD